MSARDDIVWEPTDRQSVFLACDDFEVLYGGAAGGGKSDALLIDALCLQHGGHENFHHRAILFRRSFPELRDLIDRAKEIYPLIVPGAKFNNQERIWTFPSGAKIEFGYLQHDNDRFRYRGRAWNYIGFDELTLWSTSVCYLYLFSRCRSTDRSLPRYIRATTNPDGPGQKWVMERWGIEASGKETNIPVDLVDDELGTVTTLRRRFVPARLSDNPHLSGTGYREALLQMEPEERESLLKGLWKGSKVKGAYYLNEMQKLRSTGRIRRVPYQPGVPVDTFWDLGRNDTTAIWFYQFVAGEHRFIHAYENSGEALDHYASYLLSRGYVYGTHYLPHDAGYERLTKATEDAATFEEMLAELLPSHRFNVIPRILDVTVGINQTRMKMSGNVYMDEVECADGIAAIDNYKKRYSEKLDCFLDEPLHDRYSNYADAFRQWGQAGQPKSKSASSGNRRANRSWRSA